MAETIISDRVSLIKKLTCNHFGISEEQIVSPSRKREYVLPRHTAMKLIVENTTSVSYKVIGREFGSRDHSTVIHALKAIQDIIDTNIGFRTYYAQLEKMIKGRIEGLPDKNFYLVQYEGDNKPLFI
jgi:chromosomal replication initiator protein